MMLRRARVLFAAAVVASVFVVLTEVPFSELLHARGAVAAASAELDRLRHENGALSAEVGDLKNGSTIEQIAHEEYGLVSPGEGSVVVMPASEGSQGRRGGSGKTGKTGEPGEAATPLGATTIPKSDLVPSDSPLSPANEGSRTPRHHESFWKRLLDRLEFWKAVN